ncbi:unnamed protein product [Polarella glacialis]|uniref:Phosphoribosylformylglycinamidine synthase n=1 Tax=Polarella glacialis TaxID=89957 RepID=A0A813GT48_POLGL|nr:unnamed protein product [Polarella glacialis]
MSCLDSALGEACVDLQAISLLLGPSLKAARQAGAGAGQSEGAVSLDGQSVKAQQWLPFEKQTPVSEGEQIFHICDLVFVGSEFGAANRDLLDGLGIRAVINVTAGSGRVPNHFESSGDFEYLHFELFDQPGSDPSEAARGSCEALSRWGQEGRRTLVHCSAGLSRSVTLVLAWLMESKKGLSLLDAVELVNEQRGRRVQCNPSFWCFLAALERRQKGWPPGTTPSFDFTRWVVEDLEKMGFDAALVRQALHDRADWVHFETLMDSVLEGCLPQYLIMISLDFVFLCLCIHCREYCKDSVAGVQVLGMSYLIVSHERRSPGSVLEKLFGEAPGLVYEVRRADLPAVWRVFEAEGVRALEIGATRADMRAVFHVGSECVLDADVASLHCIWEATSFQLERLQCSIPCVEEEEAGFKNRRAPPYQLTYAPEPTADAVLLSGARRHRVAIVRQEGSNGDREMAASFHMAGFEAWDVHMSDLLEGRTSLESFRGAAFVGGFSYADTLDSAKGWAGSVLFSPKLAAQFKAFRSRPDTFALGICNGAQLLALLGWVPGVEGSSDSLPLVEQPRFVHNRSSRFESRFVTVRIEKSAATKVWLRGMEGSRLGVWVNHGEGKCHFPTKAVYERVKKNQLIPMRYVDDDGQPTEKYPFCPNGSPDGIVGLCSEDGRQMAIMPHPERLTAWPWQWPYTPEAWTEGPSRLKASPWLRLFQNVRTWCDENGAS